jgi:hypothetical protein
MIHHGDCCRCFSQSQASLAKNDSQYLLYLLVLYGGTEYSVRFSGNSTAALGRCRHVLYLLYYLRTVLYCMYMHCTGSPLSSAHVLHLLTGD